MKIGDVPQFIAAMATASERERLLGPLLWGVRGVGKSEAVYQGAKLAGLPVVELRIGQMEPGEFLGAMSIQADGRTHYAVPDWWPRERSVVFLDEPNRSHRDVRNAVFQLVLDHRIGPHRLPAGCLIVGAANPPTAEYGDVEAIEDAAFISRWLHVAVEGDPESWLAYEGARPGVDWLLAAVARQPDLLGATPSYLPELSPSARSLSVARRLLAHLEDRWHHPALLGLVGPTATVALLQARDAKEQPITWQEARSPMGQARVTAYAEAGRLDLLRPAFEGAFLWMTQAPAQEAVSRVDEVLDWIPTLPIDLQAQALKRVSAWFSANTAELRANLAPWQAKVGKIKRTIGDAGGFKAKGAA